MTSPSTAGTRIAVLIDCDNVSPSYASLILEELASHGTPTIKRAYGDWTTTNLNEWKKTLSTLAIQPMLQIARTTNIYLLHHLRMWSGSLPILPGLHA